MPTNNKILGFLAILLCLTFKTVSAQSSEEVTVKYTFSNSSTLTFYLDKQEAVFYGENEDRVRTHQTLLAGLSFNRVVDNSLKDVELAQEKVVPSRVGSDKKENLTVVEYMPNEKLDVVVFEAGHQFFVATKEGRLGKLEVGKDNPNIAFEKNEVFEDGKLIRVIATKWLFKSLSKSVTSIGALVVYIEGSSELYVLIVNSKGKSLSIPNVKVGYHLSYEERYGKLFVENGGQQIAEYDIRNLVENRIPAPETSIPMVATEKEAKKSGLSVTDAERFITEHFNLYEDVYIQGKENFILPPEAFDQEEFNDLRRKLVNGSAILVGDEGSGKLEFITRFVKDTLDGKYPELNLKTHFYDVPILSLRSSDGKIGTDETKVKMLIEYARKNPEAIFIIGNIHLAKGGGTHSGSDIDIIQMLTPAIADGTLKIIATTTEDYYKKYFAGDDMFNRGVGKVTKKDLPENKIPDALDMWAKAHKYEPLSAQTKELIIALSKKFDASTAGLMRAISLQADVLAESKISGLTAREINDDVIKKVAARRYAVDQRYFESKARQQILKDLTRGLDERIAGQKELKHALINDAMALLTSSSSGKKPLGRRLFFGDRGLGKTYIPEVYAQLLGLPFERIKLDENTNAEMIKTRIAQAVRKNSMTVFLIDEVEKTRLGVQNELLDILDSPVLLAEESLDAHLTGKKTPKYVKYNIGNATFFLATNAGSMTVKPTDSYHDVERQLMNDNLSRYVIDRVADLHHFQGPQTKEEFMAVLTIKINEYIKIKEKEKNTKIKIKNKDQMLEQLTKTYFRPGASYRGAIDDLENAFKVALSKLEMQYSIGKQCTLALENITSFRNSRPNTAKTPMGFTGN